MSIGKKLLSLRRELELSQEEMAKSLYVSRQTISKWESDLSLPDMKTILLINELYHVSISDLLGINEEKESSIEQLYEQINLVNKNLEKDKQKRMIFEIILIVICLLCLCFSVMILLKKNTIVNNYQTPSYNEEKSWCSYTNMEIQSYNLDKRMMNVDIYCEVDYTYANSHIMCYLVDVQGNEYEYQLSPTKISNQYVYTGEIPLRDYEKGTFVMKKDDLTLSYSFDGSHYMSEILERCIKVSLPEEPLESGSYKVNMKKIEYKFGNFYEGENVNIKGKLQGMITLQINNFGKKREYLNKTIPLEKDQSFQLEKSLSQLEDVSTYCKIQIENDIYELQKNAKVMDNFYTVEDIELF